MTSKKEPSANLCSSYSSENNGVIDAHTLGASLGDLSCPDPRLARVIQAWNVLPEDERVALFRLFAHRAMAAQAARSSETTYRIDVTISAIWTAIKTVLAVDDPGGSLAGLDEAPG